MLYSLTEYYDSGEMMDDWDSDTVIGVFETKELAEKEIECMIEEGRKGVDARNEKIKKHYCPDCDVLDRSTCTRCFDKFEKTDIGYTISDGCRTATVDYIVKEIELNKRIK